MYLKHCGIDFGTTNSAVSVLNDSNFPHLITFEKNKTTIPSAIFFPETNINAPVFGSKAITQYLDCQEGRFMRSIKRILGTELMNEKTDINGVFLTYEDIILSFIKHLKQTAESQIDSTLEDVVLGRPVHFQDFAPKEDEKAESILQKIAYRAGFKNVSFQYEPIAAAFAHESILSKETLACVIDIGGGTSDFSIIRLGNTSKNKLDRANDILANTGIRIGGNDFDSNLSLKCFMPYFGYETLQKPNPYTNRVLPIPNQPYVMLSEWSSINSLYKYKEQKNIKEIYENAEETEKVINLYEIVSKELGHTLLNQIESTKIHLSKQDSFSTTLTFLSQSPTIKVESKEFEASISSVTQKIISSLKECLSLASISSEKIELIILTGGSTEIPYIKNNILELFPNAKISEENKLSSVAIGLSYEAIRRYK